MYIEQKPLELCGLLVLICKRVSLTAVMYDVVLVVALHLSVSDTENRCASLGRLSSD